MAEPMFCALCEDDANDLRARIAELEADLTARREAHETALRIMQGLTGERDEARRIAVKLFRNLDTLDLTTAEMAAVESWEGTDDE